MDKQLMKLVICNLNGNDPVSEVNSNSKEIINIAKLLNKVDDVSCSILKHSYDDSSLFSTEDPLYCPYSTADFDAVLVMNSNANFFGGQENPEIIETYKFLAATTKPIFYLYNDTNLPFRQVWKNIERRAWNKWTEEEVKVKSKFYVISQFRDTSKPLLNNSKDINVEDIISIDFGTWLLYDYKSKFIPNIGKYDFIYGGSARGGNRASKFNSFFDSDKLKVACYGSLKEKDLTCKNMPEFLGRKNSDKVIETNSLGFSTMVFGEKLYNDNITTIRIYESILAGCITFIDEEFDPKHLVYKCDDTVYNSLYVSSLNELEQRVAELKSNGELLERVKRVQLDLLERNSKYDCIGKIVDYVRSKL